MTRPAHIAAFLIWALVPLRVVAPNLSAEDRGVEVVFKTDGKVVKGPGEIVIKSHDRRAAVKVRNDIPSFAPWSAPRANVVMLPDWAVSTDGGVEVSLTARFKSRTPYFERVKLWQGMGRLTFVIDSAPFDDNVDYAVGENGSHLAEAHALFLEPVHGDGFVMAHLAETTRGDRWK